MAVIKGRLTGSVAPAYTAHRVLALFDKRLPPASATSTSSRFIASEAGTDVKADGSYLLDLPSLDALGETLNFEARAPDGRVLATRAVAHSELETGAAIDIAATAASPFTALALKDGTATPAARLRGFVFDASGTREAVNLSVVIWGRRPGEGTVAQPLVSATTDAHGYFVAPLTVGRFAEAFGIVIAGRAQHVPIPLEEERLPSRVVLVVDLPPLAAGAKDDCRCDSPVPRVPGSEDLTSNPRAFSQDMGGRCIDFTTPNRALEEFNFYTVVRTTEPQIQGLEVDDSDVQPLDDASAAAAVELLGALDKQLDGIRGLSFMSLPTILPAGNTPSGVEVHGTTTLTAGSTTLSAATRVVLGTVVPTMSPRLLREHSESLVSALGSSEPTTVTRTLTDIAVANTAGRLGRLSDLVQMRPASGRTRLSAKHPIDWDNKPTIYQATTVAHGHLLQFKQTWVADGYSLGDLIYSLPLAPCQKKQVAVIDWTRRQAGRRDELLSEEERLSSVLSHDRDVTDIVNSTLRESMRGGSSSGTWGVAGGMGGAGSFSTGMLNLGAVFGVSGGGGGASSLAWQDASRSLGGQALQTLRDTTMQAASATRSQRASVVKTVDEGEAVTVQTEVVANHNHCHAITIQYFEVLRHLQVQQHLADVQECLFVPLLMAPFTPDKVLRWREVLAGALRESSLQSAFDAMDRNVHPADSDLPSGTYASEPLLDFSGELRIRFQLSRPSDKFDKDRNAWIVDETAWLPYHRFLPFSWWPASYFEAIYGATDQALRDRLFQERIAPEIAQGFADTLSLRYGSGGGSKTEGFPFDADFTLVSKYADDRPLQVSIRPGSGGPGPRRDEIGWLKIVAPYPLPSTLSRAIVDAGVLRYSTAHLDGILFRNDHIDDDLTGSDVVVMRCPPRGDELRDPHKEDRELARKLLRHLNQNLEYYHRAILWVMDDQRRYMLLDGIEAPNADGRSVASVVVNRLIGIVGNSLVLPVAPGVHLDPTYGPTKDEVGDKIWPDLINVYAPHKPIEPMRISVPTRGVYAESVMGACNSCEEKDESRFWRFEESPCGDEPTPIQSPSSESRASTMSGLEPSKFPTPMINIQNAPPAPDPTGLAAAFRVLGTPGAFSNITGLDQTQRNALAALQTAMQGAEFFGGTAADLAKSAGAGKTGGTSSAANTGTIDKTMRTIDQAQSSGHLSAAQAGTLKETAIKQMMGLDAPTDADLKRVAQAQEQGMISGDQAQDLTASILRKQAGVDSEARLTDNPDLSRLLSAAADDGRGVSVSRFGETVEVSALTEGSSGSGGGTSPTSSPFASEPYSPSFNEYTSSQNDADRALYDKRVKGLQTALDTVLTGNVAFKDTGVALVDLTLSGEPGFENPIYAGRNDLREYSIGSMAKISVMYAAFELRHAAKEAVRTMTTDKKAEVFKELEAKWSNTISQGLKPLALGGLPPNFSDIFSATKSAGSAGVWSIEFTDFDSVTELERTNIDARANGSSDEAFESKLRKTLGFRQRMQLMIVNSHNGAASSCVTDLGFKYINGTLRAAGFLNVDPIPPAGAGLWVGGLFGRNNAWASVPKSSGTLQGTAKSAAALMTLIADGNLVDNAFATGIGITTDACGKMRELLEKAGSFFAPQLKKDGRAPSEMFSKVGLGDTSTCECAFVERAIGASTKLRYVAAILVTVPKEGPERTRLGQPVRGFGDPAKKDLICELDRLIVAAHMP